MPSASAEARDDRAPRADSVTRRLRRLPREDLLAMYDAAVEATESLAALAQAGKNPATAVIGEADIVGEWAHFPVGDVIDRDTGSQYYYHAHAAEERSDGEHGHFHTFMLRPSQVAGQSEITHLIALSANASGRPLRLFTTNRWVTAETWSDAETAIGMLDAFDITVQEPSLALNRWLSATLRMFRPQVVDLLRARDATIAKYKHARPESDVYEDRALQITSEIDVEFLAQIRAIESALATTS